MDSLFQVPEETKINKDGIVWEKESLSFFAFFPASCVKFPNNGGGKTLLNSDVAVPFNVVLLRNCEIVLYTFENSLQSGRNYASKVFTRIVLKLCIGISYLARCSFNS